MMSDRLFNQKRICVCGGMTKPLNPSFFTLKIATLSQRLIYQNRIILYAGVTEGLLGLLADSIVSHKGVLEGALIEKEIVHKHPQLSNYTCFSSYDERQNYMFSASQDVFFLPGGLGTFHELFSLLIRNKVEKITQNIELINWGDFWVPVEKLLNNALTQGFLTQADINCVKLS